MASFHAEFFIYFFFYYPGSFCCLSVLLGLKGQKEGKKTKKREFSISGVFLD